MGNFNLNLEDDNRYHLGYRLLGFIPINLEELGEARLSTEDIIRPACYHRGIRSTIECWRVYAWNPQPYP